DLRTLSPLLLVEGVFDALPHWPHAAAFLGKPTGAHLAALDKHRGRPIVVILDGDAWEQGWAVAQRVRALGVPSIASVKLPAGFDPGELPTSWLMARARESLAK